jgi:hypothetical protein
MHGSLPFSSREIAIAEVYTVIFRSVAKFETITEFRAAIYRPGDF